MTKTIYLAADTQEGCLVVNDDFGHWPDAYLAAISGGRARFERDGEGFMQPMEDGEPVYAGSSLDDDDDAAKNKAGRELMRHMSDRSGCRYTYIEITIDDDGVLVVNADDENALLDAATYGRAAGYVLSDADEARLSTLA